MVRKFAVLSRPVAIAVVLALAATQVTAAWADDGRWRHDDRRWDRHHDHHRDGGPPYWFPRGHRPAFVILPGPRYFYVAPPIVVYLAPPIVGRHGRPVAARAIGPVYQDDAGYYCRDYRADIVIEGRRWIGRGTAYLGRDGVWRLAG